jgi:hypothetical protein
MSWEFLPKTTKMKVNYSRVEQRKHALQSCPAFPEKFGNGKTGAKPRPAT